MTTNPIPQIYVDYDIKINVVDGHALPNNIPTTMIVGKTVRYSSPDGTVRVTFDRNGSPFLDASGQPKTQVANLEILELQVASDPGADFQCKCFITPPSGPTIGWFPGEDPESGGDHHVGH